MVTLRGSCSQGLPSEPPGNRQPVGDGDIRIGLPGPISVCTARGSTTVESGPGTAKVIDVDLAVVFSANGDAR